MTTITIMGLGLMGGSLGLALKRGAAYTVHGYTRSPERAKRAMERGAVDRTYSDAAEAVAEADVVVLCAPILAIPEQLKSVTPHLKPGAVVTDVGSTKGDLQRACVDILDGCDAVFVGSHPIAGSEQQGMDAARGDLYDGAMVVVTPEADTPEDKLQLTSRVWEDAGARVFKMSPDEHDKVLALTSHLPHLMASILSQTVGREGLRKDISEFCGTGFLNTSRIAQGGTDIWLDILKSNHGPVLSELHVFKEKLDSFIEKLEQSDFVAIEKVLEEGRAFRQSFE